jgi:signal transduction histidine kinase
MVVDIRLRGEVASLDRTSLPVRYGVAVVAVALVLLLKLALDPLFLEHQSPFLMLAGAVMVAAWFGGLGPGLLATVLGALASDYFFLVPGHAFTPPGRAFLPLLLFGVQGVLISSLAQALLSARRRAEQSALEVRRQQQELAERERELHEMVGQLIAAQEEERRRVAYEVHDGFTQMAAAAYRRLALFAEHRSPEDAQDREELEDAVALVQRTVAEARRVIANLRPTTLDDFGLATALRMQVEEMRAEGFEASYEETLGGERLPATLETALFRVAQEALTNVHKHSQTDRVRVLLGRRDSGVVSLEVRDWGRGFEPAKMRQRGGPGERVGLASMRERIALMGGSLEIRSEVGSGTSVVAEVPL